MKKLTLFLFTFLFVSALYYSCRRVENDLLKPPDNRPVYSISVEDATEADLLQQELHLPVVKVALPRVYFYGDNKELLKQLSALGYGEPQREKLDNVYSLLVILTGKFDEGEVKKSGAVILNRENDHAFVYGTLSALKVLDAMGYTLVKVDSEPRPRLVDIRVSRKEDVQTVAGIQVDIFSVKFDSSGNSYLIQGSAWDNQIDRMRQLNFSVTIK